MKPNAIPPRSQDSDGAEPMRRLTAMECLLSGFPVGTEVSAGASKAEVIDGGPRLMKRVDANPTR